MSVKRTKPMNEKLTYSIAETARVLGISRSSVYRLLERSSFPAFRIGDRTLISVKGLEEWVNSQTVGKGENTNA